MKPKYPQAWTLTAIPLCRAHVSPHTYKPNLQTTRPTVGQTPWSAPDAPVRLPLTRLFRIRDAIAQSRQISPPFNIGLVADAIQQLARSLVAKLSRNRDPPAFHRMFVLTVAPT